jgi:hypothetical protein
VAEIRRHDIYTQVFLEKNPPPPWTCEECGEAIDELGHASLQGVIHHRDEDFTNNDPSNLVVLHHRCHLRLHLAGVPKTREHADKVNAANRGQKRSDETKALQRAQASRRGICDVCGYESSITWVTRHKKKVHDGRN